MPRVARETRPRVVRPALDATAIVLALCAVGGCTSAMPLLAGGSTTHSELAALTAGGAARVPLGEARPDERTGEDTLADAASSGGVVPVVGARYGVAPHWDVGVFVAGTEARLEGRRELVLEDGSTRKALLLGAGLLGGYVDPDGLGDDHPVSGGRFGAEVPVVYAVEFGPVYDLWVGGRVGTEHLRGQLRPAPSAGGTGLVDASATNLRAGAVVGLGAGFRRLQAQLEVTAYYQAWVGAPRGTALGNGVVLVPAFALRVRL
ncbi:MAG: hypothetical protein ACOC9O_00415 [Myxococcota bacterium]